MRQKSLVGSVSVCVPAHLNVYSAQVVCVCLWSGAQVSSWQRGDSKSLENGDGAVNRHTNSLSVLMRKSAMPKRMVCMCMGYAFTP